MKKRRSICFLLLAVFGFFSELQAQDIYLFFPGVTENNGESDFHRDEVRILGISGGFTNSASYDPRDTSTPVFEPYTLTKNFDGSSAEIMLFLARGLIESDAEIRFYTRSIQDGQETLTMKIELKDVSFSSYRSAAVPCDNCPAISETFGLAFRAIRIGNFSWNLDRNSTNF